MENPVIGIYGDQWCVSCASILIFGETLKLALEAWNKKYPNNHKSTYQHEHYWDLTPAEYLKSNG